MKSKAALENYKHQVRVYFQQNLFKINTTVTLKLDNLEKLSFFEIFYERSVKLRREFSLL